MRDNRVPNTRLRDYRKLRGWSQQDLVDELLDKGHEIGEHNLGLTFKEVSRWEQGWTTPRSPYSKLLCLVFQASAWELGLYEPEGSPITERGGSGPRAGSGTETEAQHLQSGSVLSSSPSSSQYDEKVERRRALQLVSGSLLASLMQPRLAGALERPSRTDQAGVETIKATLANCRRLDDSFGPVAAVGPTTALQEFVDRLLRGSHPERIGKELRSQAAELDQFLGWLSYDLDDQVTAREYLNRGLGAAEEAGDEPLGAYILGQMAVISAADDYLSEGLAFVEVARSRAALSATPTTRAWIYALEAKLSAKAGYSTASLKALEQAEAAMDQAKPEEDPPWIYYFNSTDLMAGYVASSYEYVERLEEARDIWQSVLVSLSPTSVRDRSIYLTHLAHIYAKQGEVEEACRLGVEALHISLETKSRRCLERIRELRSGLEAWSGTQAVRELDEGLGGG